MDKKKVIELIKQAISELSATNMGIICTQSTLESALEELQKPDWISVEDELPPYNEEVLVCSKKCPDITWVDSRDPNMLTLNEFRQDKLFRNTITHWRKIDKLEV